MDKNAIKKFAVWARRELIARVSQRAAWYGITEKDPIDEKAQVIHGKVLTADEQAQRRALIAHIRREGYQQVMEEVAYTWFNRFIALRFMEVNGYLPSYTRVFSDDNGAYNPQILKDAIHLDLEGLDMEKVYAMEEANETEALFKYLVIAQCNDLNRMLPGMFQKISDYTELLFPDFLLREGSVTHQMVTTIPEDDWKDAVQIIGWLYQYYNAEPKDEVFAALKKNIKISKEKIPAATQLFTPDWIVRYMVENSLGRLWVEGHPNDELKASWKYYLEEAPQEPEVETQLAAIRAEYAQIDPASILCADPCMGSGHILVYMFDVLMQIYLSYGYTTNEAVESIVRNNLWGMDIDDRAAQLAYFAVMMKAQQYDHRWLAKQVRHPVQPHVFALQDSGNWSAFEGQMHRAFSNHPSLFEDASIKTAKALFDTFADAKEYGSIIQPDITLEDLDMLEKVLDTMQQQADLMDFVAQADAMTLMETLRPLILQCQALVQKYHVTVTNPPYMKQDSMPSKLADLVEHRWEKAKYDLYAAFMNRCCIMTETLGYTAMITMHNFMFSPSFIELRNDFIKTGWVNLLHLGSRAFSEISGEVVQTASYVLTKSIAERNTVVVDVTDINNAEEKEVEFFKKKPIIFNMRNTDIIPWNAMGYGLTPVVLEYYRKNQTLEKHCVAKAGVVTGDDDFFCKLWYEVSFDDITLNPSSRELYKYVPFSRGGTFVSWYGNTHHVLRILDMWDDSKTNKSVRRGDKDYYYRRGIGWSQMGGGASKSYSVIENSICKTTTPMLYPDASSFNYILGYLNSPIPAKVLKSLNPTLSVLISDILHLPYVSAKGNTIEINALVDECITLAQDDYDQNESSWGFQQHPLLQYAYWTPQRIHEEQQSGYLVMNTLQQAYETWAKAAEDRFNQLKANEEKLNRIFIDIYGLQDELSPDVDDKDMTVRKADLSRDIRSLISYSVGCMLGRYSLDKPGLAFAGGTWDESQYVTYHADHDGILPITDDEYFDDDIVGMFVEWVRTVYGAETLEANLKFIADALGGKGNPRDVIRQYFLNDFYKDHLKIYQKRPIYWLFDSGKKNGFKCLIYMHRYQPDTIARIRTDYLHETQARYHNAIETLERQSAAASTSERVKMTKRLNALKDQAEEARVYEEKIHHLADQMIKIDLDDGVKVNYAKFQDVLAPIK